MNDRDGGDSRLRVGPWLSPADLAAQGEFAAFGLPTPREPADPPFVPTSALAAPPAPRPPAFPPPEPAATAGTDLDDLDVDDRWYNASERTIDRAGDRTADRADIDLGEPTAGTALPLPEPSSARPSGWRGRWWFVVAPLAVIALVVAVALQLRGGPGADPDPPTPPDPSPQVALPELTPPPAEGSPTTGATSASNSVPGRTGTRSPGGSGAGPAPGAGAPAPGEQGGGAGVPVPGGLGPGTRVIPGAVAGAGRCLNPVASGMLTYVQLTGCDDVAENQWRAPGDGTVRANDRCLTVLLGGISNGTPVIVYSCIGSSSQAWQIRADGTWRNPASGRCLSTDDDRSSVGTRLSIWDCGAASNQKWVLT